MVFALTPFAPAVADAETTSLEIAERLAGAIRFEAVSYEDASDFRGEPFDALEGYLRETYPRVFRELRLEKVNGYTLLFEWKGSEGAKAVAALFAERGIPLGFRFDEGGMIFKDFPLVPGKIVATVVIAEKAHFTVVLKVRSVNGHSSMPPKHTAIGKRSRAITRVENNPMPAQISLSVREVTEVASDCDWDGTSSCFGKLGWTVARRRSRTSEILGKKTAQAAPTGCV